MVQKDSVNTSRPCASLTTMQSSGSSCPPACFNSLTTRAANLRASSSSCRIVPSVLPYSLTLSRHVTTKWYRGKCAPLCASENSGSIWRCWQGYNASATNLKRERATLRGQRVPDFAGFHRRLRGLY